MSLSFYHTKCYFSIFFVFDVAAICINFLVYLLFCIYLLLFCGTGTVVLLRWVVICPSCLGVWTSCDLLPIQPECNVCVCVQSCDVWVTGMQNETGCGWGWGGGFSGSRWPTIRGRVCVCVCVCCFQLSCFDTGVSVWRYDSQRQEVNGQEV